MEVPLSGRRKVLDGNRHNFGELKIIRINIDKQGCPHILYFICREIVGPQSVLNVAQVQNASHLVQLVLLLLGLLRHDLDVVGPFFGWNFYHADCRDAQAQIFE